VPHDTGAESIDVDAQTLERRQSLSRKEFAAKASHRPRHAVNQRDLATGAAQRQRGRASGGAGADHSHTGTDARHRAHGSGASVTFDIRVYFDKTGNIE
jgi:hypothetical protein